MSEEGIKFDSGKPEFSLIPPFALEEVAKVLTFGAKKYKPNNWKYVPDAEKRYHDAIYRHLNAYTKGEEFDSETNLHHLAHAICCAMFIIDLKANKSNAEPLSMKRIRILNEELQ